MISGDTIVAISSAIGSGARVIVRASGPLALSTLRALTSETASPATQTQERIGDQPGSARLARLSFSGLVCPAWVYVFHAPRSVTGEDLVEYHLPGNSILAGLLVSFLLSLGHRQADAGEFTARAYFNGRIDLTAAEGVAAMVSAHSEQEMLAARRLMAGELARQLAEPMESLATTAALLEVGIDFSDEDVTFLSARDLISRISGIRKALQSLLTNSGRLERLSHEPSFVLVGKPNAGKSTLLNRLAGGSRAVTSSVAGTTRDALSANVALARGICRVLDIAGIEFAVEARQSLPRSASDEIDAAMRATALRAIDEADFVIAVSAIDDPMSQTRPPTDRLPDLKVATKVDLFRDSGDSGEKRFLRESVEGLQVSALTGEGIGDLRHAMDQLAFGRADGGARIALNLRHVEAVQRTNLAIDQAVTLATQEPMRLELLAAELREALAALGEVVGRLTPDDLLGRVFSRFCIGK